MTGVFKSNNPYNNFLLLIYGLLLKLPAFLYPVIPVPQPADGFFFRILLMDLNGIGNTLPVIYPLITFLLLFTQAITFNKLANEQRLMQTSNYLTAMSYLLITSLFKEWNILSAPLIINSLLVWVWARMSGLNYNPHPKGTLFNIGLAIGCSTFFYFPSIAFTALIIFGLILIRPFKLTEWLIAFIGIITPFYFFYAYIFLTDQWKGYKFPAIEIGKPIFYESRWALAAIIIVLISTIIGLFFIRQYYRRQLVQTRKSWNLVFLYFFVAFFIPFINVTHSFKYWILSAIPLSVFVGCAFLYPQRKWFPTIIHWLIVAFVIAFSFFVN